MNRLVKNRVNIFDKLAFGISFVPLLCFCTMFTYYFNEGLMINGNNIANDGMFYVMKELIGDFFKGISFMQLLVILILFMYQLWFIMNVFMTKVDKRKKKKTHDFGLFVLSVALWAEALLIAGTFIVAIWDFEWIMVWFIGLYVEYQPLAIFFTILLFLALINIIYNVHAILTKGMSKYLKDCENSDYQFTRGELCVGMTKIFIVLLLAAMVGYRMMFLII